MTRFAANYFNSVKQFYFLSLLTLLYNMSNLRQICGYPIRVEDFNGSN